VTAPRLGPTVPDVLDIVNAYYAQRGNEAGGNLHIVLDDGNVRDGDVAFCLGWAIEKRDKEGEHLAQLIERMSTTQRRKLYRSHS
jgi:hypothetical protein